MHGIFKFVVFLSRHETLDSFNILHALPVLVCNA